MNGELKCWDCNREEFSDVPSEFKMGANRFSVAGQNACAISRGDKMGCWDVNGNEH